MVRASTAALKRCFDHPSERYNIEEGTLAGGKRGRGLENLRL